MSFSAFPDHNDTLEKYQSPHLTDEGPAVKSFYNMLKDTEVMSCSARAPGQAPVKSGAQVLAHYANYFPQ